MTHAESEPVKIKPQAAVHYVCARRQITVADGRAAGAIARCPGCGDATVLPPRGADDPVRRVFQIECGRVVW